MDPPVPVRQVVERVLRHPTRKATCFLEFVFLFLLSFFEGGVSSILRQTHLFGFGVFLNWFSQLQFTQYGPEPNICVFRLRAKS